MPRDKPLYCCFSVPQQKFLTSKNIRYEVVALNPNTKCTRDPYGTFTLTLPDGK